MSTATPSAPASEPASLPQSPRADSLAEGIFTLLIMTVAQRLVGLLRQVLVCRWFAPEELGQWDLALGFLELAAPVAVLGIPGCFGRYVEHYRQRGHLRHFLAWTGGLTVGLGLVACLSIGCAAEAFSRLVFNSADQAPLMRMLAVALGLLIAYNFTSVLLTALRRPRWASRLEFVHSLSFFLLSGLLLWGGRGQSIALVTAYAAACAVAFGLACYALRDPCRDVASPGECFSSTGMWSKLLPFAFWVWGTNWLANVFELADRYMLVHFSGLPSAQALAAVGNYHSSRVFPLLLVSVAGLLGTMLTPYLSHDWERGRRDRVNEQLNLTLKCLGLLLLAGGAGILLVAHPLFLWGMNGKYAGGLAILPVTTSYCIWFALARVAQKYLWCAERVWLAVVGWAGGILVNIVLNLALVPVWGLLGVAVATAAGNIVSLLWIWGAAAWLGFKPGAGTWAIVAGPLLLLTGSSGAAVALAAVLLVTLGTQWVLHGEEKQQLLRALTGLLSRVGIVLPQRWALES